MDVGVERDGLVHSKYIKPHLMKGRKELGIGDKLEVKVISLDIERKRLSLELLKLM